MYNNQIIFPTFDGLKVRIGADHIEYFCKSTKRFVNVTAGGPEDLYPAFIRDRVIEEPVRSTLAEKY